MQFSDRSQEKGSQREIQSKAQVFTEYPVIVEKVNTAIQRGFLRVLFTDVDATLVLGSGHHTYEVEQSHRDARCLVESLNAQGAIVIPVTGSHFDSGTGTTVSIEERIARGVLPLTGGGYPDERYRVDAYVTDGGAKAICDIPSKAVYDQNYEKLVSPAPIDYKVLLDQVEGLTRRLQSSDLAPIDREVIHGFDAHAGEGRFSFQSGTLDGTHQQSHKVALHFYASSLRDRDFIELQFVQQFSAYDMKIVCCEEKDANSHARRLYPELSAQEGFPLKYCLDIVPYNKASAVDYFSKYVNYLVGEQALVVGKEKPLIEFWACGDSGNDMPLFCSSAVTHAVMVGGASEELLRAQDRIRELGKWVYVENDGGRLGPASIIQALSLSPNPMV